MAEARYSRPAAIKKSSCGWPPFRSTARVAHTRRWGRCDGRRQSQGRSERSSIRTIRSGWRLPARNNSWLIIPWALASGITSSSTSKMISLDIATSDCCDSTKERAYPTTAPEKSKSTFSIDGSLATIFGHGFFDQGRYRPTAIPASYQQPLLTQPEPSFKKPDHNNNYR